MGGANIGMESVTVSVEPAKMGMHAPRRCTLHRLPWEVCHDGPAKVSTFFMPEPMENSEGVLRASFWGRGLRGQEVKLPAGYAGVVMEQRDDGDEKTFVPKHHFDQLTYWNHDIMPSSCDTVTQ